MQKIQLHSCCWMETTLPVSESVSSGCSCWTWSQKSVKLFSVNVLFNVPSDVHGAVSLLGRAWDWFARCVLCSQMDIWSSQSLFLILGNIYFLLRLEADVAWRMQLCSIHLSSSKEKSSECRRVVEGSVVRTVTIPSWGVWLYFCPGHGRRGQVSLQRHTQTTQCWKYQPTLGAAGITSPRSSDGWGPYHTTTSVSCVFDSHFFTFFQKTCSMVDLWSCGLFSQTGSEVVFFRGCCRWLQRCAGCTCITLIRPPSQLKFI